MLLRCATSSPEMGANQQERLSIVAHFGTSTSVLLDKSNFDSLLAFEPEVIEFYNYPSSELPRIENFCNQHKIKIALHTPTPYDRPEPLRRFAPTGPNPDEARIALEMALTTVRSAAHLGALHVVVHFPTPYVDFEEIIEKRVIDAFLDPLVNEAHKLNVRVLMENLSSHPTFHLPVHYAALLDRYEGLEFCLDFGHAQQLGEIASISDFVTQLGSRIRSCHVYNRNCNSGRSHIPVHPDQQPDEGWIDLQSTVTDLLHRGEVATWIMEPDPQRAEDLPRAHEGAKWFRNLVTMIR